MTDNRQVPSPLDRRRFLARAAAMGAASLVAPSAAGALTAGASNQSAALGALAPGEHAPSTAPIAPGSVGAFELDEFTVAQLGAAMREGKWTSRAICEKYLGRIAEIDKTGPALNAIIELNPDALAIADALDAERRAKGPRGPLHGIPVLIKDNIDTGDRMRTSAGSLALAESVAPRDSFVAERLRAAGCVILGKTNPSEWANFRSSKSTSGWSGRGGLTRNPYVLDRNACGSSTGTGVAISASLAAIGIGTETDGSIVCPSSLCGLVGIKPTVGLVSRAGIIPISHTQDTAGPMCRTVTDAALLLGALTGVDPRDPATKASAGKARTDYSGFLNPDALKGARIGVARSLFGANEAQDLVMERALAAMRDAGAVLVDPADVSSMDKLGDAETIVLRTEFKAGINAYLASLGPYAPHKTLADLIAFNEANREREMPWFGQDTFIKCQATKGLSDPAYLAALAKCRRLSRTEGLDATLARHQLAAIVAPTKGPAWLTDVVSGARAAGGSATLAAVAGYPSITVPAGDVAGLPVGLSFMGAAWNEGVLISLAFAFERATTARRTPRFLPTLGLPA